MFGRLKHEQVTINTVLAVIERNHRELMSNVNDLQNAVSALQSSVSTLTTDVNNKITALGNQISDLQAQLAAGTPVSQEQLDALVTSVGQIQAAVTTEDQVVNPPAPPAA